LEKFLLSHVARFGTPRSWLTKEGEQEAEKDEDEREGAGHLGSLPTARGSVKRPGHLDGFTALHNNSRMNDACVAKVTILVNLVRSVGAAG
jgi:hypothetical protein